MNAQKVAKLTGEMVTLDVGRVFVLFWFCLPERRDNQFWDSSSLKFPQNSVLTEMVEFAILNLYYSSAPLHLDMFAFVFKQQFREF